MARIGIICGMASEVRNLGSWAEHPQVSVGVSGARPDRAEVLATHMIDEAGVGLLVSWGIAGGLAPGLAPGAVVMPSEVVTVPGERYPLAAGLLSRDAGDIILGAEQVIMSVAAKADMRSRTSAVAVDMETHRVARAASGRVPCVAIRAVSDPADRALPDLTSDALDAAGNPRIGHVVARLALKPWQLPALLAAKRDSDAALAALGAVADEVIGGLLAD